MYSNSKYFVLFLCVVSLDAVKFRCDYVYHDVGWFKYNEVPMTWNDARFQCHLEGAILASPTTSTIANIMQNAIGKVDIFTGFRDFYSTGHYYSIEGTPLYNILHTWADSEPDNKNKEESCISLNSYGKMSDINCDEPRPFMCYRKNSNTDVNSCGNLDPEYQLNSETNKCYKFHTKPREFHEAYFVCSAEGGHLAIVNNNVESQAIRDIFARHPPHTIIGTISPHYAFIGFQLDKQIKEYITIHGQLLEDAGFKKFDTGEPNNAGGYEYCGSVTRNGLLNDLLCNSPFPFICEKIPNIPAICAINSSQKQLLTR